MDMINRKDVLNIISEYKNKTHNCEELKDLIDIQAKILMIQNTQHAFCIKNNPNKEKMEEYHRLGFGKAMTTNSIFYTCSNCNSWLSLAYVYCPKCGCKLESEVK